MHVDLHMLRVLMLHEIDGEVDGADVVAVDEGGALKGAVACGARGGANASRRPLPRRWLQLGIQPLRWSGRQRAAAWWPRRRDWHLEIRYS
jgi:hypothetical protein